MCCCGAAIERFWGSGGGGAAHALARRCDRQQRLRKLGGYQHHAGGGRSRLRTRASANPARQEGKRSCRHRQFATDGPRSKASAAQRWRYWIAHPWQSTGAAIAGRQRRNAHYHLSNILRPGPSDTARVCPRTASQRVLGMGGQSLYTSAFASYRAAVTFNLSQTAEPNASFGSESVGGHRSLHAGHSREGPGGADTCAGDSAAEKHTRS